MTRPPEPRLQAHPDRPLDWDDPATGPVLEAVFDAYFDCRRNKRNTPSQLGFEIDLERNLVGLWRDLRGGTYEIGPSEGFVITSPRLREVWAAQFRDRVVHHLVYNALAPRFVPRFIRDSYASIPGRGTLDAMQRARRFARSATRNYSRRAFALKIDIASFFASIDRERLVALIAPRVPEPWLRALACRIARHDVRDAPVLKSPARLFAQVPPSKSLLKGPPGRGLPIGNLTSQFFANIYLHELDHYVKHELRIRHYGRYVDDMLLIDESPARLNRAAARIDDFLRAKLGLALNPAKTHLNPVASGFDFVGFIIKPGRVHVRRSVLARAHARIAAWEREGAPVSPAALDPLAASLTSTLALLRQANGFRQRQALCRRIESLFLRADEGATKIAVAG